MSCPFVVFEAMGPPGSSPRTLGEHVGWAAGSRPLDSGAPHMVPPAAEQLGTRVSRAWHLAGFSRIPGGEEPCKRAWVGCQMRKAVQHLLVCAKSSVSTRRVGPFVRSSCGNRPAACTQTVRSALAARGCPSACRAGDRSALAAQGRASVLAQVRPPFGFIARAHPFRVRSTHLTGSLGSTQTELGPLVGGESECLGGVGQ